MGGFLYESAKAVGKTVVSRRDHLTSENSFCEALLPLILDGFLADHPGPKIPEERRLKWISDSAAAVVRERVGTCDDLTSCR
jgi:hypothetical protein